MTHEWDWHQVISPNASQRVDAAVHAGARGESRIRVEAGYVPDPQVFDPYATGFDRGRCTFRVQGQSLLIEIDDGPGHLQPLYGTSTIGQLVSGLRVLNTNAWIWVDLFLFRSYEVTEGAEAVGRRAWEEHLVHLLDWLT